MDNSNNIKQKGKDKNVFSRSLSFIILIAFFVLAGCNPSVNNKTVNDGWSKLPDILKNIKAPQFPDKEFVVTDFGAKGDSVTDCTLAFKKAIEACNLAGGGKVVVPQGSYSTGAIYLKSNVNLHLEDNSRILFYTNPEKYLPLVFTRFEGVECMNFSALIYAFNEQNIAITGEGILDGQADYSNWWAWKGSKESKGPNQKEDVRILNQMGEDNIPVEERIFGLGHYLRPNFVQFYKCQNILVDGITILRSPMWEIHPVLSENITIQNVNIFTHGPNNDGCNPESSKNVLIKDCVFDTGDDCIAIKSGRNNDGRRVNVPSENIVIQGCKMKDGHGGVVIGSEISGSCRNVFAEDCIMDSPNLDRALRIKTNSLRGGVVENIYMRNVKVGEVIEAVVLVSFTYQEGDVGKFTPIVRNIHVKNVTSEKSDYGLHIECYERSPVTNIYIDSCRFNGVKNGNFIKHAESLHFNEFYINGEIVKR
ncbi:MAG: glycoside hydrolase family 28 protein [Tenuifilaceae bacterium]